MVEETENISLSSFCNLYQDSIIGIFYCSVVALSYLSFASRVFLILVSTVSQMFLPKSLGGLGFTPICSHITPMQVVSMQPCEKHRVFKVSLFLLWFQHDHILIQMFLTLICVCVCVCVSGWNYWGCLHGGGRRSRKDQVSRSQYLWHDSRWLVLLIISKTLPMETTSRFVWVRLFLIINWINCIQYFILLKCFEWTRTLHWYFIMTVLFWPVSCFSQEFTLVWWWLGS